MLLAITFGFAGPFLGLGLTELIIIGIPIAIVILIVVVRKTRKRQGHEQGRIERYAEKYGIPVEEFYPTDTPPNQETQNPTQQPLPQEQVHTFPPPQDVSQSPMSPEDASALNETAPVLQTWKTSVGFSILGLLVGIPLLTAVSMLLAMLLRLLFIMLTSLVSSETATLVDALTAGSSGAWPLLVFVENCLMIIYALKVYPSYFTDKPVFKSSKVISFANFAFGAVIFGILWNTNLTAKKKGVSYIVSAVGSGLMIAQFLFGIIVALVTLFGSMSATATNLYTDAETGASFSVPSDWTEEPASPDLAYTKANFYPPDNEENSYVTVSYASSDDWSQMPEAERQGVTRQDYNNDFVSQEFLEYLEGQFGNGVFAGTPGISVSHEGASGLSIPGENVQIEETVIGKTDFFEVSSTGTMLIDGQEGGFRYVYLIHFESGYNYAFEYFEMGESKHYPEFEAIVASTTYPAS
jgi:hypothetical protein